MIIKTKLHRPLPKVDFVRRKALIPQLDKVVRQKLTIISAPAGFGKSHLVASWCSEQSIKYAWLSLDSNDKNPDVFLTYLVAAIKEMDSTLGDEAWSLVQGVGEVNASEVLSSLLSEFTYYSTDIVLILDDYHLVDSEDIKPLLHALLEQSPSNLHLLLITRKDPNLSLAKLRVQGELLEIRAADLRFSDAEAQALFQLPMNNIDNSECSTLANKNTEGWAVGLQLSALALRGQADQALAVARIRGAHSYILDYLTEEVLTRLPEEIRQFLFETSVLSEFSAELCDYALKRPHCAQYLSYLEQNNVFLISLDSERIWYRYHHLFADVLKVHAHLADYEKQQIYWRAATWYAEQHRLIEAVKYGFLSNETSQVVELIEAHWPTQRANHHDSQLIGWLAEVSDSILQNHPVLSGYYGLALLSHDPEKGMYLLDRTRQQLERPKAELSIAECTAFGVVNIGEAYIYAAQGNTEVVMERTRSALAFLSPDESVWRGAAKALAGIALWRDGNIEDARKSLLSSVNNMDRSKDLSAQITSRFLLADFYYQFGWLNQAKNVIEHAIEITDMGSGYTIEGSADAYLLLAEIEFEQGSVDKATVNLDMANQFGVKGSMPEAKYRYPLLNGRIESAHNKFEKALNYFIEAEHLFHLSPTPCHRPPAFWKAVLQLNQGNVTQLKQQPKVTQPLHIGGHLYVPYLLASLDSVKSIETLFTVDSEIDSTPNNHCITLLIKALSDDLNGHTEQAKASLKELLGELTEHNNTAWMTEIKVLKQFFERHHLVNQIVNQNIVQRSQVEVALLDPLSAKEREVLQWLDSELTGPQIALRLFISLNTLRTHTKNIYSKLTVNNRRAAINKAKKLAIFSEEK